MEGERRIQIIVAFVSAVLLVFSYGVGYYVGKGAGVEEERKICEVQKKQLIKTLSRITPVSRPEPVEEKVVVPPKNVQTSKPPAQKEQKKEKPEVTSTNATPVQKKVVKASKVAGESKPEEKPVSVSKVEKVKSPEVASPVKGKKEKAASPIHRRVYFLQVGVFKTKSNAVKLAQELNRKGFHSKTVFGKKYVKVIVGDFESLSQARAVQRKLRRMGFDSILKRREI